MGHDLNTADCTANVEVARIMNETEKKIADSWIMDFGCSFHICSHKAWFEGLIEADGFVLLGNNQVCAIKGIGNICFKVYDGSVALLT